jgi:hypothetical protein
MKHQWILFGEDRINWFTRLRWCSLCGKVQKWSKTHWYMRVDKRFWCPKVGRCPGKGAKGDPRRRWMAGDIEEWNTRQGR